MTSPRAADLTSPPISPETGFLRIRDIIGNPKKGIPAVIPVSRTTWWAGVKSGRFPKGVDRAGVQVWKVEDIRALAVSMTSSGVVAIVTDQLRTEIRQAAYRRLCELHADGPNHLPVPVIAYMMTCLEDEAGHHLSSALNAKAASSSELLPSREATVVRGWIAEHFQSDKHCDACCERMGGSDCQHFFELTPTGFRSYFLCSSCAVRLRMNGRLTLLKNAERFTPEEVTVNEQ
jgi:prophage regulatory protein